MSTKLLRQIKNFLFSSLKLTLLISFLISQSFLAEIYLCQNNPDAKLTNIAKAEYNNHWYDTAFLYRKQIAINHTTIQHIDPNNTNPYLSNFPLLVSINIPANKVRNDRNDIIFTNQDGTQLLNYDIENYDGSGNLIAWVQLPRLNDVNNTTDTTFYVYYDNPAYATANATASSVWDSDFKAVYHLKESGGGAVGDYKDSTINHNDSTSNTNEPKVTTSGQLGSAETFNGSTTNVTVGHKSSLDINNAITLSAWVNAAAVTNSTYEGIIHKYYALDTGQNSAYGLTMDWSTSKIRFFASTTDANGHNLASSGALATGSWYYVTATYDSSTHTTSIYINGILDTTSTTAITGSILTTTGDARIGAGPNGKFNGTIDEAHISAIARSADWIKTEYDNQSNPNIFYNLGGEESYVGYFVFPVIAEVTPVSTPTSNVTPSYTFSSTKFGNIIYGGDCSSSTTSALVGNNTITFNALSSGTHSNCTIRITDELGNSSNILSVSGFAVNIAISTYIVPAIIDSRILPKSYISSSYISNNISTQVSPGEYKAASFVINSNLNVGNLQIEISNLSGNGHIIPNSALDIKTVKCWYQSVSGSMDYVPNGRYLTPELLLKDDSLVNVDGDTWTQWNTTNPDGKNYLKINGSYTDISDGTQQTSGRDTISISERPIQDAVTLQPINLPANYNKQFWITLHVPDGTPAGSYTGIISLKNGAEVIKSLNVNVQVLPINLPLPNIEYSIYYRGTIENNGSISSEDKTVEQYTAEMQDMRAHGVTNPTIYPFGTDNNLLQELSIRQQAGMDNANVYYAGGIAIDKIAYYKNLTVPYGGANLYQYGPDENPINVSHITSEHSAGGLHLTAEYIYSYADSAADTLDLLVAGNLWPSLADKYHSYGHKIYLYNTPQTSSEYPRTFRMNYGLKLWQNNYDGAMDYAYQDGHDIWNDFNHSIRNLVFAYPTSNGVIDTIQWEGFREGINDMRYLTALQNAISSAKTQGKNTSAAENYLTQLKSSDLTNQDLDAIRSQMIQYILSLTSSSSSSSGSGSSSSSSSGGSSSGGSSITSQPPATKIDPNNLPSNITQIIISYTPDFKNVSWQTFDLNKFKTIDQTTQTLYIKLKTKDGKISDTIIYTPKSTSSENSTTSNTSGTGNNSNIPLTEGDIVKTPTNPDVYIIKYKNSKQYKRLILSPSVFKSYQHLKWTNLKIVSQQQLDQYSTSNLVYLAGDNNIYSLTPYGDEGERRILNTTESYDQDSVYEVNKVDRDSYKLIK